MPTTVSDLAKIPLTIPKQTIKLDIHPVAGGKLPDFEFEVFVYDGDEEWVIGKYYKGTDGKPGVWRMEPSEDQLHKVIAWAETPMLSGNNGVDWIGD